jgi:hypothetical protein
MHVHFRALEMTHRDALYCKQLGRADKAGAAPAPAPREPSFPRTTRPSQYVPREVHKEWADATTRAIENVLDAVEHGDEARIAAKSA